MKLKNMLTLLCVGAVWAGLTLAAWLGPAEEGSDSERRKLAQMPALSVQTLLDGSFMEDFESYSLDQFPLREGFRRLKARVQYDLLGQKDNNGIYIAQGQAAKLDYPLNEASVANAVAKFNAIYEKYLTDSETVVFSVVPDKGYFLAEANGYPAMDYAALFDAVREGTPWAEYADITDLLEAGDYYATDTHWRQEKLLDVAQRLCDALGAAAISADMIAVEELKRPFYGVHGGQAAIPMDPDRMYLLRNDLLDDCRVYNRETGKETSVYDLEKLDSRDLYDVYLSGAAALLTLENPAGDPGRELIVFRDSFGSSLVPLLVADYGTVTVVDTRYIAPDLLDRFVDFHGQDVLFLYSTLLLNSSNSLK